MASGHVTVHVRDEELSRANPGFSLTELFDCVKVSQLGRLKDRACVIRHDVHVP
jgi:hypothetical protein